MRQFRELIEIFNLVQKNITKYARKLLKFLYENCMSFRVIHFENGWRQCMHIRVIHFQAFNIRKHAKLHDIY